MKEVLAFLTGALVICLFLYGVYWVAKTVSYSWWYEDMVQDTVREMVRPEYLMEDFQP